MRSSLKKRLHRASTDAAVSGRLARALQQSKEDVTTLAFVQSGSRKSLKHEIKAERSSKGGYRLTCTCEWYRYHRDDGCSHLKNYLARITPLNL